MGGLRGVLAIDARRYQIEPRKGSSTFEHVLYLLKSEALPPGQTCAMTDDGLGSPATPKDSQARVGDMLETYPHPKYLELVLAFDHDRYVYSQSNLTQVVSDGIFLAGIVDTYFQYFQLRISIRALEVWTDEDKINFSLVGLGTLKEVIKYRVDHFNPRVSSDWIHVYHKKTNVPVKVPGRMCNPSYPGTLTAFHDKNYLVAAVWTAHVLGHALGISHDTDNCLCKGKDSCIMKLGPTGFSNCSYGEYWAFTIKGGACLANKPEPVSVLKRCGNKFVEEGEECDCGSREECEKDRCCQPNCKLRRGAHCATGLCCHNCRFRPSGYTCRKEENECDLAEYCMGNSSVCPDDFYKQDGTPCKYEAICFGKMCRSRFMQCQSIFGPDAREAPYQCYEAVNTIGDQYGNCAIKGTNRYAKCSRTSSLCGRIQCVNIKKLPDLPDHSMIIATHLQKENLRCWGIGYHLSMVPMGFIDVGIIGDGTSCGKGQICFNRTCMNTNTILTYDCAVNKCNRRGFCNNLRNCHCMHGWRPPFCEEAGPGGSKDSGPPGPQERESTSSVHIVSVIIIRLILLVISGILVYLWGVFFQKEKHPPKMEEYKEPR
ncbi:disintegrin and metalloproteinase domain-containing protein 30-like [Talpa occidentalis]|uniref:disintegrin and metalloproteinase domain-containing protein 30-like n=1 Tax=Talpa occidentalis TaxID=50954 RepID=UPI00188FD0CF|nr:disintegrin and metalloproteinase domain-containing protein 30-like [Talpa occidentalis]